VTSEPRLLSHALRRAAAQATNPRVRRWLEELAAGEWAAVQLPPPRPAAGKRTRKVGKERK
jgi:hypothetical protein